MTRKIFKAGNSLVVSLPKEAIEALGLEEGSQVELDVDAEEGKVVIHPKRHAARGVDPEFAQQVSEFIEEYRPALEKLAEGE